jgi:hypothetical protein
MLSAVKKLFDWTESDIAAWERIRKKGLWRFMSWYGLGFSGILFIVISTVTFFSWLQASAGITSLLFQLLFTATLCLLGGLIASLGTWWLEENIYLKIMRFRPRK